MHDGPLGLIGDVFQDLYDQTDNLEAKGFLIEASATICIDLVQGRVTADRLPDYIAGTVAGYRRHFDA